MWRRDGQDAARSCEAPGRIENASMTQNIHDDPAFFEGYSKLGRSVDGLAGTIAHVEEWGPTDADVAARPELAEERERPMMLLVSARR